MNVKARNYKLDANLRRYSERIMDRMSKHCLLAVSRPMNHPRVRTFEAWKSVRRLIIGSEIKNGTYRSINYE